MKRGLAIPIGLSLFGIAVASFVSTRSAEKAIVPTRAVAVAPASIEVAANDDYLPPLLGIFDDQEVAVPGALAQLTAFSEGAPRPLSIELMRQVSWPSAQPGMLMQVGYDNPLPLPLTPSPKLGSGIGSSTSILIPDLSDPTGSSSGSVIPPMTTSTPIPNSAPPSFRDSGLIRPKPLTMETSSSLPRVGEPPLAGAQSNPLPPMPGEPIPAPAQAVAPLQPTPAANLSEYTGCGCQPRIGPSGGCHAQIASPCASSCVYETPICCQSFSSCCQSSCGGCQVIEYPTCCGCETKWRPFSKIRGWFRGEQKGCCGSFEEVCCDGCGSGRKSLFSRFRGLFHKNRDECGFVESCEIGCPTTSCCGQ